MTLGQRIGIYRKQSGISQEELGARLGVSRQAVSKWENDITVPGMNNLLGLAREFGISVAELTQAPEAETSPHAAEFSKVGHSTAQGSSPAYSCSESNTVQSSRYQKLISALGTVFIGVLAVLALQMSDSRNISVSPLPDGLTAPEKPRDEQVVSTQEETMTDMGSEAYAVNNTSHSTILKNGDPDYSNRQDICQEPIDATRQVYIAWNQLVTNENLSAEERYTCRSQVFSGLPDMDWQAFGALGTTDALATSEAFVQWLREQTFSDSELFWLQVGLGASGLDGAYAENYDSLLAAALFQNPIGYAKQLPRAAEYGETVAQNILSATAYGANYYAADCAAAVEKLDAIIGTNALTTAENAWTKLLRHYLEPPNDGDYADYPNIPKEWSK